RKVDYMFTGWFAGALDQVAESLGYPVRTQSEQTQCAAEEGCEVGYFEVKPL
ncbi:MAG: hydrocarbon binding protein, partial [Amphritea sp.]|nr:hydrocarbon binding protein [Amphritea sp.]